MRPHIELDDRVVAANVDAWRRFAAPSMVYGVVKANAYGWGIKRVASLLEPLVDAFCVSDSDELDALRCVSQKRTIILGSVSDERIAGVLARNAVATMETEGAVRAGIAAGTVRLALQPAAAFSGVSLDALRSFAPLLAQSGVRVELSTHITDLDAMDPQLKQFANARHELEQAGVRNIRTDVASTFALTAGCRPFDAVRLGIGIFGATGGAQVQGVRCALRLLAPVVKSALMPGGSRIGYGGTMLRTAGHLTTLRCGYADGLPKTLEGSDDILSVGMQYVTIRGERSAREPYAILDAGTDLDRFASQCGRLPHEIVTALGNAAN